MGSMKRLLLVFCLLIPLAIPMSATADHWETHLDIMGAVDAGNAFWDAQGLANPCVRVKVDFQVLSGQHLGEALRDLSDPCMIVLTTRYVSWTFDPLTLCKVVTHEIGHVRDWLLFHIWGRHTPTGIMRSEIDFQGSSTPQCDAFAKTHQPVRVTTTQYIILRKKSKHHG